MGEKPIKPTRRGGPPWTDKRDTDLTVLTPPVGMPAMPRIGGGHPTVEGTRPLRLRAEPPGAARAPGRCVCGHARGAHEHYRSGRDCGICGAATCAAYRPPSGRLRRMLRRLLPRRRDRRR